MHLNHQIHSDMSSRLRKIKGYAETYSEFLTHPSCHELRELRKARRKELLLKRRSTRDATGYYS